MSSSAHGYLRHVMLQKLTEMYLVTRAGNHSTKTDRHPKTKQKTGEYSKAQNHITLSLSEYKDRIQVGGHFFTEYDESTFIPTRMMDRDKREVHYGVRGRIYELWVE